MSALEAAGDALYEIAGRVSSDLRWLAKYRLRPDERAKTAGFADEIDAARASWEWARQVQP